MLVLMAHLCRWTSMSLWRPLDATARELSPRKSSYSVSQSESGHSTVVAVEHATLKRQRKACADCRTLRAGTRRETDKESSF